MSELCDADRREAARLWREGYSLGAIAKYLDISIYALSPWLYADELAAATREADQRGDQS